MSDKAGDPASDPVRQPASQPYQPPLASGQSGATTRTAVQATQLVAFMWLAYFLNYCDRQAVFSMFPALKTDLGFDDRQLGLIGAVFLWVYGIGCPIAGWAADRFSKRVLVVLSLVIWSAVTIATGFVSSVLTMLLLRAAMGISESLYMPAAVSLTANAHAPHQRSRAVSVLTTAQIMGTISGGWFGGWMAQQGQWRAAFFILGCVGIVYALPYFLFLRQVDERPVAEAGKPAEQSGGSDGFRGSRGNLLVPTYAVLCVIFPVFVFGLWMLMSWLPAFLSEKFRLTMGQAGFTATVYLQGAMLVGLLCGGVLADMLFKLTKAARLWLLVVSLVGCAPCLHYIGNSSTLTITCVAAGGFGLLGGFLAGNIFPAAFEVVPSTMRASAVGWLNFFGAALSGFAPLTAGVWKKTVGIEGLLTYTSIAYVAAAAGLTVCIFVLFPRDYERVH